MTRVPDGFDKPRRKLPDLRWLAIPALAVAIFAFIMVRVWRAKQHSDRTFDAQMFDRLRNQPPHLPDPAPAAGVPGPEQDGVTDLPGGQVERRFAGLVLRHPAAWQARPGDNPLGRSIAFAASGSALTVLVVTDVTPDEMLAGIVASMKVEGATERTIAGQVRAGTQGTVTAMGITARAEVFAFTAGRYTVVLLWQYEPAAARQAMADLAALTQLAPAD
jgi:hypothetical protein